MKLSKKAASKPLRDLPGFILWGTEAVVHAALNRWDILR